MHHRIRFFLVALLALGVATPVGAAGLPDITTFTRGMRAYPGYFNFYWDARKGRIWLEIDKWETQFLYVHALSSGVGANALGMDRGQIGGSRVVFFRRVGPRVLLIQPNLRFRALTTNEAERRSVEEAFAQSVLWGFDMAAASGNRVLVDLTEFLEQDPQRIIDRLRLQNQGNYKIDPRRSAINLQRTRNFPKNSEFDVLLTYVGDGRGNLVRSVTPEPKAVTVHLHHSFIELPDDRYQPRIWDPRSGFFGIEFMDFSTPIGEPLTRRYIARHRLRKKDPGAPVSEPVEPIVYYLDPGTPEPVRSALLEGARWWNEAFEAIGYRNAFQVKILPANADLLDVRYNVIEWVHRSTRGWSYGSTVIDPRTGEIIKGHVLLGSQRVRQDYKIAAGLVAPFATGQAPSSTPLEMALARLRQLAAHEVGHTLGLRHNYVASVYQRASVMDYPHPLVRIRPDGTLDLSEAYAVGIGAWDKAAIAYGYQDFAPGVDERQALRETIRRTLKAGLVFLTDPDARPPGSAHPLAHLWDNGADPVAELEHILKVREIALRQFSERNMREGWPWSMLEEVFLPIYLFHRYQTTAAAKVLGGELYLHAVRGDGQIPTRLVPPDDQRRALDVLLQTLQPRVLSVPSQVLQLIPPGTLDNRPTREILPRRTGASFDPLTAAEAAADHTVRLLLHPQRAARLIDHHARDPRQPDFSEVLERLIRSTWQAPRGAGYEGELRRVVDHVVLYRLMDLIARPDVMPAVRARAWFALQDLKQWIRDQLPRTRDRLQRAHLSYALFQIERFEREPHQVPLTPPAEMPPGAPIGDTAVDYSFGFLN